jgi:predicted oxidoreductase (fatty acid repression mutant protein)
MRARPMFSLRPWPRRTDARTVQHFNFLPGVAAEIKSTFDLPEPWIFKAQLVFGKPAKGPDDKTFEPLETRVIVKA